MNVLTLLTFLPLGCAALAACLPEHRQKMVRSIGLAGMTAALGLALWLAAAYDRAAGGLQFIERHVWIPGLQVEYFLGADGLGLLLVVLAALICLLALLVSGRTMARSQVILMLALETTMFGTFTALNFVHWFLFYELSLLPAFFLVCSAAQPAATRAAIRFFVYTLLGGLLLLVAFLGIQIASGTFDLTALAAAGKSGALQAQLAARFGGAGWVWLFPAAIFLGLAVKVPVVPFHTWLPDTYAEAPSPVSMLLTGVMSKMGLYGMLRLLVPLFPETLRAHSNLLLGLALVTILLPAFAALVQTDLKRMLAYSSVNHLGYCLLGIFAVTAIPQGAGADRAAAMNGVFLQMFNHGLTAALLFALVAFIERRSGGARSLGDFGGLRTPAPVLAGLMGIAMFSSLGLPGLNGFVGEFLIFKGAFGLVWWAAAGAAIGLLVTAVFLLTAIQRIFTGPVAGHSANFPDLTTGEILVVAPALGLMFALGIWPRLLIDLFNRTVLILLT